MSENITLEEYDYTDNLPFTEGDFTNRKRIEDALESTNRVSSYDFKYVVAFRDETVVAYALIELYRFSGPGDSGKVIAVEMTRYGKDVEGEILEALKARCDAIMWGRKAVKEMEFSLLKSQYGE